MRIKTIAKLIILIFIVLTGMSFFRTCTAGRPASSTPVIRPASAPVQIPVRPAPAPVQQKQASTPPPQAQAPQVMEIKPLTDISEAGLIKGNALLDVYNVGCNGDDNLPASPVWTSVWQDMDNNSVTYSTRSGKTVLTACTMGRFRFYYRAATDGIYVFGLRLYGYGSYARAGLRVSGSQIFGYGNADSRTNEARLGQGWYELDLRFFKDERYSGYGSKGFTLMVKAPPDTEMHVFNKDEIFHQKGVGDAGK